MMRGFPRLLPALAALRAAAGQELTYATELQASAGQHVLTVGHAGFGPYSFDTRGFNQGLPGPTFRMKPGETLRILLRNNLSAANNVACSVTTGEFCETATTNLHTHGLHVSSRSTYDGLAHNSDDVFVEVAPGGSASYEFDIPDCHMGGTHWYHPHHHHATALQAGGGAAGVLIVDDPAGYLPSPYDSMTEKVIFISGHNLQTLMDMAVSSQSSLLTSAVADAQAAGLATNVFMVNGQLGGTVSMGSHTWYRFRLIYAAVEQSLQLSMTGNATCQMMLLAKDGVYLHTMPRSITQVRLYPGARADVAISCTCAAYPCVSILSSGARRLQGPRLPAGMGGGGAAPGTVGTGVASVQVLQLYVTETAGGSTPALPSVTLQRPCYLADLRQATAGTTGNLNLQGAQRRVQWNGAGNSMTYAAVQAVGSKRSWPALATLPLGSVVQLAVTGANAHPLHLHVQPYQITNYAGADDYFQVGDWHDTLMVPTGDALTVRQQLDNFTGKMVVHCHILEHEDEGMMAFFDVSGTEGATYAQAETLDPTCYRGAFVPGSTTTTTGSTSTASTPTASTSTGTGVTATATTTTDNTVASSAPRACDGPLAVVGLAWLALRA